MQPQFTQLSRRSVLRRTALGLVGLSALSYGAHRTTAAEEQHSSAQAHWTQYKADAGHSARIEDGVGPSTDIEEAWSNSSDYVHDGVAVVGETVYAGGKQLDALNAANGKTRWSFDPEIPEDYDVPEGPPSPDVGQPAVMDGIIYANVGFGPFDASPYDSALIAVDAQTGTRRWRFDIEGETTDFVTPVTVADGTVVVSLPTHDIANARLLTAFSADGEKRWQTPIDEREPDTLPIADGKVYVPSATGVRALDLETGEVVWSALPRVRFAPAAPPMVADGTLFVAEEGKPGVTLIALDAATGEEYWRTAYAPDATPGMTIGTADESTVYIDVNGIDATVIALDRTDGSERWRTTVEQPDEAYLPLDGFALVDGLLYKGAAAIDPTDGSTVWTHPMPAVGGGGWHLDAVAGGRVYLSSTVVTALTGTTDPGCYIAQD